LVQFAAPNTPNDRVCEVAALEPPFLYCVAILGVTGAREGVAPYSLSFLERVRRLTTLPALAGFGVRDGAQAASLAAACDGVIVGSALARSLAGSATIEECAGRTRGFLGGLRHALGGAAKE
jgi:tryptophan synthase alpha subunit